MAVPLLARLYFTRKNDQCVGEVNYDPITETATMDAEQRLVVATQSLLTNAHGDPTSDEPTDR